MDEKIKYLLLRTVQDDNILPLTSVCNMNCLFCSHQNNPPGLQVYRFGHLPVELLEELIDFLSPGEPVIIGESATRIIEGEPLLHPQFRSVLKMLRERWPEKVVQLTTNGSLLSREQVAFLGQISPLELNISINCANPEERVFLMGDQQAETVFEGLSSLSEEGLKFSGSIVAAPHLLGWESLEQTLDRTAIFNPETVRVFFPGFSRYTAENLKFEPLSLYRRLQKQVESLLKKYRFPIILEPPLLQDFSSRIKGIIPGSAASGLPLQRGDIILKVDDKVVETRVDCFHRLLDAADPLLELKRGEAGRVFNLTCPKERGERPGIVLDYDLDPGALEQIESSIIKYRTGSAIKAGMGEIVIVTSTLAERLIKNLAGRLRRRFPANLFTVLAVKNRYFGGSIGTAGLLTNQDIRAAFQSRPELRPGLILLPGIIYDIFGKDLTGEDYKILTEKFQGEVIII